MDWLSLPLPAPAPQVHVVIDHGVRAAQHVAGGWSWPATEAVGVLIAAVTGSIALWYSAMPLCDLHRVKIVRNGETLRITTDVKNVGSGYSPEVKIWLLEYGGVRDFTKADHYIAPMGPHERLERWESADIVVNGGKIEGDKFRVLLRWTGLLWTVGETYVEEHFGEDDETSRRRIKVVYFPERILRWFLRYDWKGRD